VRIASFWLSGLYRETQVQQPVPCNYDKGLYGLCLSGPATAHGPQAQHRARTPEYL